MSIVSNPRRFGKTLCRNKEKEEKEENIHLSDLQLVPPPYGRRDQLQVQSVISLSHLSDEEFDEVISKSLLLWAGSRPVWFGCRSTLTRTIGANVPGDRDLLSEGIFWSSLCKVLCVAKKSPPSS